MPLMAGPERLTSPTTPLENGLNDMATQKKRKGLSDDYAIALMVLHHGGNPISDITPFLPLSTTKDLDRKNHWINLPSPKSDGENNLAARWFRSEADAAQAYCEFYGLGET